MGTDLRPDGVHFTAESAIEVADWLGPAVLEAVGTEPNPLAPPPQPPGTPAAPVTTTTAATG
jgi:hypothetical protein